MPDRFDQSPLRTTGLTDYHVHPDFSVDAEGTVSEFCSRAHERGLAGVCFTSHFDANPCSDGRVNYIRVDGTDLPATIGNLSPYVEAVLAARSEYEKRGLLVILGIEFGWYPGCEQQVEQLRAEYDFDYVLCGIHELENICLCSSRQIAQCFSRFDAIEFAGRYFAQATAAAECGLFDAIAHIPYYLRYGPRYYGEDMLALHNSHLDRFAEACVRSGTSLEINTSGIRHGCGHYYPTDAIITALRQLGVTVDCLGSDAHHPDQLALDFDIAAGLLTGAPTPYN